MTKVRQPFSTYDAVHIAIGALGLDRATKVAGYSQPTTMYALGNPEKDRDISFDAACALDIACCEESGLTPFFDVHQHRLEGLKPDVQDVDLKSSLLEIFEDLSQLSAKVRTAAAASSPGGEGFTAGEKAEILPIAGELMNELKTLIAVVNGGDGVPARRSPSLFERFTTKKADEEAA